MTSCQRLWISGIAVVCALGSTLGMSLGQEPSQSAAPLTQASRSAYLDDLFLPHHYAAGKSSFIMQRVARGEKRTLLDLTGSGSVRHIWLTWSPGAGEDATSLAGQVLLRVFLNGEPQPAVEGTVDELFQAAEKTGTQIVPLPAFNYHRSFNLYLPIYFGSGVRIEAEPTVPLNELFFQIDYRKTTRPESSRRLVSRKTPDGVLLEYTGPESEASRQQRQAPQLPTRQVSVRTGDEGLTIPGPAILRQLTFEGEGLDDLELLMLWDDEPSPAVQAPLRYFFGGFTNAAVESQPARLTTWFPMPFRKQARLVLRGSEARQVTVSYALEERTHLPEDVRFFHARFSEQDPTLGYIPYLALQTEGAGHFVGVNLFDTGHNHGGGDTALIDPGSDSPGAVHGINGEDYFAFAWHETGRMTPLSGAPVHERRYRLHLENPYPFEQSLRFTFGVFAGNHPKSVAFWYQAPGEPKRSEWKPVDAPWNVLGPLTAGTALPDRVDDRTYDAEIPSHQPVRFAVKWQPMDMRAGFLDLTDHFRHFTMTRDGSGFLIGKSVMRLITYVHSATRQNVEVRIGHDDPASIALNGKPIATLEGGAGLHSSSAVLPLETGWNELAVTLDNSNNVNWRWNGLSLAVKEPAKVCFALRPE